MSTVRATRNSEEQHHRSSGGSCRVKRVQSSRGLPPFVSAVLMVLLFVCGATAQNKINTVVGGGIVDPHPLTADLPGPTAVVEDTAGNLYIAPPASQYIFEWSKVTGLVTIFAGTGYISDHHKPGLATTEPLWSPYGLAADSKGNIYIADTGNNAIKMVDSTGYLQTVVGTSKPCLDSTRKCGDMGPALLAELHNPQGVALDSSGNIYVADTGDNRVRCVIMVAGGCHSNHPVGTIINYAGTVGVSCSAPTQACGDGGKANQAFLNQPIGIAIDSQSGYLYIADSADNRVRRVGLRNIISTVAGTGKRCVPSQGCGDGGLATSAHLNSPLGVSVDSRHNLYIADTQDNVVRIVSSKIISTIAGDWQQGFSGDGGSPLSAELNNPNGVYVDSSGAIFISDTGNQRVRQVTSGKPKVISTILGGGDGGDGGLATGGNPSYSELADPRSIAVDKDNNWYIADTANNRIRVVNTGNQARTFAGVVIQPGDIQTVAGTGEANDTGDGSSALSATLNSPFGVAVGQQGDIFIADSGNRRVREVTPNGIIHAFAGNGTSCSGGNCGDGGPAIQANLTLPSAIALDPAGNVFIADAGSQRVREVSNGTISTVAGTGKAGFSGNGGPATRAKLNRPFGVAVDRDDNLFIADSNNNVIRCVLGSAGGCRDTIDPVGTIVPYAYTGKKIFGGDNGPPLKATRWLPSAVALDANGNLFVGGGNDAVIQRIDASSNLIMTVAGNDQQTYFYGFFGDGFVSTKAHINGLGVAVDSNDVLLSAELGNDRIRSVPLVPVDTLSSTSLNFGKEPVGQTSQAQVDTLQNTGLDDLTITSILVAGDFAQTNTCPAKHDLLPPTLSCRISITFTPAQKGVLHGTVTITDNSYQSPHVIKLVGIGK